MKTYLGHSAITECQIDRLTSAAPHHNFQTTFGAIIVIITIIISQCHSPTWEKEHYNPTLVVVVLTAIYISVFSFCMVSFTAAAGVGSVFTDHFALRSA